MTHTRYWPLQLMLGWLNLVLTAPIIYLYLGLPMIMRQHGWSGIEIGLFQLAGLPAVFKFLLATPVDRYHFGRCTYRSWSALLMALYASVLILLALYDIQHTPWSLLFSLALAASLIGTWADIPVNALAITYLPESERIRAGAIRSAATSLGAIVGGGIMLLMQTHLGWAWPFVALALLLVSGVVLLACLRQYVPVCQTAVTAQRAGLKEWLNFFATPDFRRWSWLILLYFPFIGAAWVYVKPLMLDQGFDASRIAAIVGIGGGLVGALGSLAGSRLTRHFGSGLALPAFALLSVGAISGLLLVTALEMPFIVFAAAALLTALAMGMASGLIFGLMMYHTRPGLAAVDYGIQSSLFAVVRTLVPMAAGIMLGHFGSLGMLFGLLAGVILAFILASGLRHSITAFIQTQRL
ncbi:MFS transporter [Marinobacterium marinum]|uniref:MFS transporter n=1 Tax=Marinobacterium marinum TaxID=2756129 RepID=A0A7W1WWY9_9GAMM|nr:MFS transporter [Marinobacterium marinum]MBA4501759.1 MFS transporter [Marinobacterium marinum]